MKSGVTSLQAVSSVLDTLVDQYECECTQTDIQRMELVIMQKLEFNLTTVTPLDFLKIVSDPKSAAIDIHNVAMLLSNFAYL